MGSRGSKDVDTSGLEARGSASEACFGVGVVCDSIWGY